MHSHDSLSPQQDGKMSWNLSFQYKSCANSHVFLDNKIILNAFKWWETAKVNSVSYRQSSHHTFTVISDLDKHDKYGFMCVSSQLCVKF